MKIKILQLNILKGQYIDNIVSFVKNNNFDILCLQEVTAGKFSYEEINCLSQINNVLGFNYEKSIDIQLIKDPESNFGNAILFSKKIKLIKKKIIYFDKYPANRNTVFSLWDKIPRTILSLTLNINNQPFEIVTTHLVWSDKPVDTVDKITQGNQLIKRIKELKTPFVLTGDFNVDQKSSVIQKLSKLARNLTLEHNITNTLNPRTHRIKELFPPGLACDFIFTSKSLPVVDFKLIDSPDLSDHYGLLVEIKI
jgi:endonuclease/exonuclease/phosphatase family metal-dependent hydrolase